MNDEVKHTPEARGIETGPPALDHPPSRTLWVRSTSIPVAEADARHADEFVTRWNNYDRLREVNADLLAALEAYMRGHPCEGGDICPTNAAAHAAIARARGENVNA